MDQHVQISLSTRDKRFSVPSTPISVPRSSTVDDLQNLLSDLLTANSKSVLFDFLIEDEFLDCNLDEYLLKKKTSAESLEIEYTCRQAPPEMSDEIHHDDFISCIKRRGQFVLTSSYDETIQMQSVLGGPPIFTLTLDHKPKVVEWISVGESEKDNRLFLSGGFGQVVQLWCWNPAFETVKCVAVGHGHKETVLTISATALINGCRSEMFATGSWDSSIKVWSASEHITDLSEETGGISHQRKSEEKLPVRIPRLTLAGHRNMVSRVCWFEERSDLSSGHGVSASLPKLLSCSWDQTIRVWDVNTSSEMGKCGESRCISVGSPLHDLSVASQGILAAASDNKVRIYDLRAKDALSQIGFQGHTGWLTSVCWAPHRQDQFVTGSVDKTVRLWDTRKLATSLFDIMGHTDMVTCVDWAPPLTRINENYATKGAITKDASVAANCDTSSPQHFILSSSADGSAKIYRYAAS